MLTQFLKSKLVATSACLALFAGCSTKSPQISPEGKASEMKVTKEPAMKNNIKFYKLANGLEVYAISKKNIPMVTVLIAVKNGSFIEDESNNGLAHLYEHMFFKANEKIPSQPEFFKALDELGVELGPQMNAYTSTESVRYFFTLQSQYLSEGLTFFADALLTPKFLQEELERERKVVIGEFDRYEASPQDVFFQRDITKRMFPIHFVRKNVIGKRETILTATRDQMFDIQRRYYIPNNSALFIVGDFDEAKLKADLEKNFGPWRAGPNPSILYPVPEHPALTESKTFISQAPVQTVNIALSYHGPKLTQDDTSILALDLMSGMLSLESSPFQKELVHSGLATSASFHCWSQRYTSPLFFTVETTPELAQKAYDKLMELVGRMNKGNFFSPEDLKVAQDALEVHTLYEGESGQRYALSLASVWTSTGSLDFYENYVSNIKKITTQNVDEAVKKYISEKPFVFGALVPENGEVSLNLPDAEKIKAIQPAEGAAQ
jgi:zinc protease